MIVQELYAIQERCGYLPAAELRALSERIGQPLHRLHEVASFFPHYRLQPPPAVDVRVCRDMSCHLRGSMALRRNLEALANELGPSVVVQGVSCLGQCDRAPSAAIINDHVYWGLTEQQLRERIQAAAQNQPLPHQHGDRAPAGWRIDLYNGKPLYEAVRAYVKAPDAAALLKKLEISGLRGMGGAGFPTFRKWTAVRNEPGDVKYIICNADESEPGTFKDRELLRRTPYLVIEAMVLAALVTGAKEGWIYVRHEYHDEIEALDEALKQARAAGIIGDNVLGSGQAFTLATFISPGGYIQGEESALLEAMEDKRGEPRNKPPFPTTNGLNNKPTVINNVETLAWVPAIALRGGEWYRDQGINGATGLRFVSISGEVTKPGVYEVPLGQTVRDLIFGTAGGVRDGRKLKAIATSGPSGGFLPTFLPAASLPEKFVKEKLPAGATGLDILDLKLDFNTVGAMGGMLGAAFVVYGDRANMLEQALNCVEFFRNESCGKCVPCRLGSQKMVEMIGDMLAARFPRGQLPLVNDLKETMALASICGLGQVAGNPIASVLKHFPQDVDRYLSKPA